MIILRQKCFSDLKKQINGIEVNIGDSRENVRKLGKYTEFKKTRSSENTTDAFSESKYKKIHVFYDKDDKVKGIEVFNKDKSKYYENKEK